MNKVPFSVLSTSDLPSRGGLVAMGSALFRSLSAPTDRHGAYRVKGEAVWHVNRKNKVVSSLQTDF